MRLPSGWALFCKYRLVKVLRDKEWICSFCLRFCSRCAATSEGDMLLVILCAVLFVASVAYRLTEWQPFLYLIMTVLCIVTVMCEVLIQV